MQTKRSYLAITVVVVGFLAIIFTFMVMMVGLLLLGGPWTNSASAISSEPGRSPLDAVDVQAIDPALALASLGGMPMDEMVALAIDTTRPETALAALLFHPTLPDTESAGNFLLLADAYIEQNNLSKAALSYRLAGLIAILSPDMVDTVRSDLLIQAGEGLVSLEQNDAARFHFGQAFVVAAGSPFLQAAHQRAIFERLHQNYIRLGDRELARQSLNLSANPPELPAIDRPELALPSNEAVPLPEPLQAVEARRWAAAQELAVLLAYYASQNPDAEVEALAAVLREEDQQKMAFYDEALTQAPQLSKQIDITAAQIEWLAIKYRIARQGYGLSIVPDWETNAGQIRADLTKAYEQLFALYADLIVALPDASRIDQASVARLRREVLAGELGRYPNYPREQRRRQLIEAGTILAHPIQVGTDETTNVYRLILQ